ncbi:hypothetical protein PHMEG_00021234 [Phytophthora megakarya]|uniref:Uncharacterized protein n=1 Tax=Phytophthora megakarya TaxID=4795 RepID=A0A225VN14_9STRA|nr:hypothetical protein PHMEG_00021234 [Phytophthora megakarya]
MASRDIAAGALAFVGPPHVPSLDRYYYLTVVRVNGTTAVVRKAGPDTAVDDPQFDVKVAVLRHRVVDPTEAELWPGSYVGHPIAFVQPAGDDYDLWAYGLVTSYSVKDESTQLHVRHGTNTLRIHLVSTSTVIAVDRLNYALQTGAFVNVTAQNALELLDNQNQVIVACGKSRAGLPAAVTSTMLSVPFNGHERVALIRPDTLEIVLRRPTNNVDLTFSDTDDEEKGELPSTAQADIDLIRLQNRPLRKRARLTEFDLSDVLLGDEDVPVVGTRAEPLAAAFRPSQVEQDVHNAVAHASLHGKQAQLVLESAQQGPRTKFLATPAVLRGAYDISFGIRGLSLMHFRRFFDEVEMYKAAEVVNMVNFGRSNTLQPAVPASSIDEIVDAFNTLLYFAKDFYNPTVYDFIKAGADFIETYAAFSRPDSETCRMLVHWINSKLGKFRATVITSGLSSAVRIGKEFTRSDDHLMELYQSQTDRRAAATSTVTPGRPQTITRQQQNREHRGVKTSSVPKELLSLLPKQGNKSMCMRFISKKGCIGPTPGKCFDPNRAHFKPMALPADAKSWIERHFHGLASEFQDL